MPEIKVELITPSVPNFIRLEKIEAQVSISDLSDQQLKEVGAAWTLQLLSNAAKLRKAR